MYSDMDRNHPIFCLNHKVNFCRRLVTAPIINRGVVSYYLLQNKLFGKGPLEF